MLSTRLIQNFILIHSLLVLLAECNDQQAHDSNDASLNTFKRVMPFTSNISTLVGESVSFNCSLYDTMYSLTSYSSDIKLNPTWLKADAVYNQYGYITAYKTENIIITRKGISVESMRDKLKLISLNEQFQTLKLLNVNIRNEGKYICREFNSQSDKLFYLNVFAGVTGLTLKLTSSSKYFRNLQPNILSSNQNTEDSSFAANLASSSISIKENDELVVNCSVNSSKPAANLSIWIASNHRISNEDDIKKLDLSEYYTVRNKDLTLKSIGIARYTVTRNDNLKSVTCVAENTALDEKWETKKSLNVLYSPRCSKYQKEFYTTGINQTIELECRMSDANPPYLDFDWILASDSANRDKTRSNGFTSRITVTPRSINDFGEITCKASNGLDSGECKMQLKLGGPPNPPEECFHKENNKTFIIECKPGFDQGDPEVYFYLLKKKTNGALVEYARKRDSCSFLISNLILEEHMNDFYIYSSNKYGNNKDKATRITIENKEFLLKSLDQLKETSNVSGKKFTIVVAGICVFILAFVFFICALVKCHNESVSSKNKLHYSSDSSSPSFREGSSLNLHYNRAAEPYKYSSHLTNYKSDFYSKNETRYNASSLKRKPEEKADYSITSNESVLTSEYESDKANVTTNPIYDNTPVNFNTKKKIINKIKPPSILNNIQDLDMSPKSKRLAPEIRSKDSNSRSLTDETTETDSENYIDFTHQKIKLNDYIEDKTSLSDDPNRDFYSPININNNNNNNNKNNSLKKSNGNMNSLAVPRPTLNGWYTNDSNDEFSGLSVDKSIINANSSNNNNNTDATSSLIKLSDFSSFNRILNGKLSATSNDFDEDLEEKRLFQWPRNNLPIFSSATSTTNNPNETSSLDVDDEKIVGILV